MSWLKKKDAPTAPEAPAPPTKVGGKGRPTPKRRDAEARGARPLVPVDRKVAKRAQRARQDAAYERQRQAMATGDDRYLPVRDKGPVRRYIRDYVDARYSVGEWFIPMSFILLVVVMVVGRTSTSAGSGLAVLMAIYALFFVAILDAAVCWILVRRRLSARFGPEQVSWRLFFYTFGRCFQLRRWRMPKPQVSRRRYPS